jgi:hypothetical protein
LEVRVGLGAGGARHRHREVTGGVDAPREYPGDGARALLAREEDLECRRAPLESPPDRVGATSEQDKDDGGSRGKDLLDEPALEARKLEVVAIAPFPDRAAPEEPRVVAHRKDGDVRRRRRGDGLGKTRFVGGVYVAPSRDGDAAGELGFEGVGKRRHVKPELDAGAVYEHVVGKRVAAEHRGESVGVGADRGNRGRGAGSGG